MFDLSSIMEKVISFASNGIQIYFIISIISFIVNFRRTRGNKNSNLNPNTRLGPNPNNMFGMMPNFINKETEFTKPNVTLESWAGSPEVIEECNEVISYIENKDKYKVIGAEMPKGILLEGPPGTGKTLLAKAIASETNSTFISMSGSEFVELFVGMGAARVRELFDTARANRPTIIFIDEIDAVGRQRGAGVNMANDEREQTLNQLLYEMDGFGNNDDIVIIAATNRKDVLDQALLRPGRFDRIIRVPLPDKTSREQILSYYLKNKNLDKPFDVSGIAELADGFSGAQLKNLINEAAIISAKNNYTVIQEKYVFDAFEKLIVGLIKSNSTSTPATKLRVAIHESGHALLALKFNEYFEFQKVSIQPTYNGAGGYTIFTEKPEIKEGGLYTKDMLKKRLIITMGGKAAESIYYGNDFVSLGAVQDLKQANGLAKRMIGNFGMGDKLEVFFNEDVSDESNPFLGKSLAFGDKYSEQTRLQMDKETLDLVKSAYSSAKEILEENREKLIEFSELL
jgi:cell division protease FtsH